MAKKRSKSPRAVSGKKTSSPVKAKAKSSPAASRGKSAMGKSRPAKLATSGKKASAKTATKVKSASAKSPRPAENPPKPIKTPGASSSSVSTRPPARRTPTTPPPPAPVPAPASLPTWSASQNNNGDLFPLPVEQLKKIKSGLSAKDLAYFRQLLMEKRAQILGDVQSMNDVRQASGGDLSHMPVHMADIGSDNYEQEFTLGLVESEARLLREIDEAIIRIREGYYGVCVISGKPISRERLEAKPWAKYSIEVAREMEKRGLR